MTDDIATDLNRIGPMLKSERRLKILRFWLKKRKTLDSINDVKKVKYSKRKKVADKKLRINGKFVSKK